VRFTAPSGDPVAITYLTSVIEPSSPSLDDVDAAFIISARQAVPRLLAAAQAALEPHRPGRIVIIGDLCNRHEAHRRFSITSTEAAHIVACADCPATAYLSCDGCGIGMPLDRCPARAAITRALLGSEEGSDDTDH
jgi:hypothetical protein